MADRDDDVAKVVMPTAPAPQPPQHDYHYVVKHPFEQYAAGQTISQPDEVHALLDGPNLHHCLRVIPR